jgi:hypothetical protein
MIRSVALDSFRFAQDVLEALRANDWEKLKLVPDIQMVDLEAHYQRSLTAMNRTQRQPEPPAGTAPDPLLSQKASPESHPHSSEPTKPAQGADNPRPKPPKRILPDGDLRYRDPRGPSRALTSYQVLQKAGWIKPAAEFFEPGRLS